MDSNWREWRRYETLWDEFEANGWELGPVKYVDLPPIMAEFGRYRIVFRYRDPASEECLFEVRRMHEGEERRVVLTWGVPTTREAEELLDEYGAYPDELPAGESAEPCPESGQLWGALLPPVVQASGSRA